MSSVRPKGHVFLVGAGPGDPDLLTLKALRAIQSADVVVHDRLVSSEILSLIAPDVQRIDVGKAPDHHPFPQGNINALLVSLASRYKTIVRLKGGDPFMFGRGSEETCELRDAGVAFSVIPGISAAQGVAASTGAPLTHRGLATGVRFVTGHCRAGQTLDLDWDGLADPNTTLVVYMGRGHAGDISNNLMASGLAADTPVMLVSDGTRPTEARSFATLGTMEAAAQQMARNSPVLIVIGRVVSLANELSLCDIRPLLDQVSHG